MLCSLGRIALATLGVENARMIPSRVCGPCPRTYAAPPYRAVHQREGCLSPCGAEHTGLDTRGTSMLPLAYR
eukprot:7383442-Prymnesium_polylepis.2